MTRQVRLGNTVRRLRQKRGGRWVYKDPPKGARQAKAKPRRQDWTPPANGQYVGPIEKGSTLVGDVHPLEARARAGWLTPVPGGVGPLTIAMLLRSTLRAARRAAGLETDD